MSFFERYDTPRKLSRLLGLYAGVEAPSSTFDRIAVDIISDLIPRLASSIGVDEEFLRKYIREPYMRRGLSILIHSFMLYGVVKP